MEEGDFASHRTMNRSKKWSKVFAESVHSRAPIEEKVQIARGDNVTVFFAKNAVAKKIHALAKIKLYQRSFSCKRTIENLKPPNDLIHFKPSWKTSTLCDICMKPALSDSILCHFCDLVVHIGCHELRQEDSLFPMTPKMFNTPTNLTTPRSISTPKVRTPSTAGTPGHAKILPRQPTGKVLVCKACRETQVEEYRLHEKDYEKVVDERRMHLFAKYLSKIVYTFVTRRKFLRQKEGITKIQSILRGYFFRKRFVMFRRRYLRVLHLQPLVIPKLDNKSMLVLTVFDNVKNVQLFRLDRQVERMSEDGFIIPGMATTVNLVLTLVVVEGQNHLIVGQASFSLRDVDAFKPQDITFTLSGNIPVHIDLLYNVKFSYNYVFRYLVATSGK